MFDIQKRTWALIGVIVLIIILGSITKSNSIPDGYLGATVSGSGSSTDNPTDEPQMQDNDKPSVNLVKVADLNGTASILNLIGTVESENDISLRAQAGGIITSVSKSQGDNVSRGTVIAVIENSSERARIAGAEASLDAAQATLDKTIAGVRSGEVTISRSRTNSALASVGEAQQGLENALRDAYTKADDAIRGKIDILFDDPRSSNVRLKIQAESQLEIDIEWERRLLETTLTEWFNSLSESATADTVLPRSAQALENLDALSSLLDKLSLAVNRLSASSELSQATLSNYQGLVIAARSQVNAARSSVTTSRDVFNAKKSLYDIAIEELDIVLTGGRNEDVRLSEAGVAQAQASLAQAQAAYNKTIIRTPISGRIIDLGIDIGDFVSMFEQVGRISGNTGPQVKTSASVNEIDSLSLGSPVTINGIYTGRISNISPALDEVTKRADVEITVNNSAAPLIHGQSVSLQLVRTQKDSQTSNSIIIPLSALKISAGQDIVFVVSSGNALIARPVVTGSLLGSNIEIISGLSISDLIVEDVRGLQAGQEVVVVEN